MRTILAILTVAAIGGCDGAPQYPYKIAQTAPGVHAEYGRFKADANANGTFIAENVDAGGTMFDRHFKASHIAMMPDVTPYWNGSNQSFGIHAIEQQQYWTGLTSETKIVMDGIPPVITAATPLIGPFLNSLGQAKLAAQQRPSILMSLADLVKSGKTTLPVIDSAFKALDPNLASDVGRVLNGVNPLALSPVHIQLTPEQMARFDAYEVSQDEAVKRFHQNTPPSVPFHPGDKDIDGIEMIPRGASVRATPPTSPLSGAASASPPDRPAPVDRAELASGEVPPAPSRDDVRRAFALSEGIQARLPETELVRFK